MTKNEIILLVISLIVSLGSISLGVLFLLGKGSFLIAGYNTMSKSEQEKVNIKVLMTFVGKIVIIIGLLTPILIIGGIYNIIFLIWLYVVLVIGLSVFAVVYANTKEKFKNK